MKKIEINIGKDILGTRMALHEIGKKVSTILEDIICDIPAPVLIVINLFDTDPLDYEFVNNAFARIFNKFLTDSNLFIAFKCGEWEMEELFTGVTKILKIKEGDDESDKRLLIENGVSMIVTNKSGVTQYVTPLIGRDLEVLAEIEKNQETSSFEIQQKFKLNAEDTSKILSDLLKCKFIYVKDGPVYLAVKTLI